MLFNECLEKTYSYFKSQNISTIGKGSEEIMTDPQLFEAYTQSMLQGVGGDHKVEMAQLLANTNAHILTESALGAIAPVSSFSGPIIRKLWPAFALKNAVNTKVATSPAFMINWIRPYYITVEDGYEKKHYVPDEMLGSEAASQDLSGNYEDVDVVLGTAVTNAVTQTATSGKAVFTKAVVSTTGSRVKHQPLDRDFTLVSVKVAKPGTSTAEVTELPVNVKLGISEAIVADAGDFTVLVRADLERAEALVSVINTVTSSAYVVISVKLRGHVSSEYNEVATTWSFDTKREDILVGTGDHFMATLSAEALKDMNAMYSIDGMKTAIDLMTNGFALQIEGKILKFIKESFKNQPKGIADFAAYPTATDYLAVFNVKPMAGFVGGPKAWREELKPVIDHLAARIKNHTHLGAGIFNIIGNPLDIQLITNVDWKFRGGQGTVDGVAVDYSLGEYQGSAYTYKIVSTETVPQGFIYIDFIPADNNQMTYNYWAYSFSTEMGYRDANHANLPSVMMTNRDVLKSFIPAIACIQIIGNDAGAAYDPFRDYVPTKTYTEA